MIALENDGFLVMRPCFQNINKVVGHNFHRFAKHTNILICIYTCMIWYMDTPIKSSNQYSILWPLKLNPLRDENLISAHVKQLGTSLTATMTSYILKSFGTKANGGVAKFCKSSWADINSQMAMIWVSTRQLCYRAVTRLTLQYCTRVLCYGVFVRVLSKGPHGGLARQKPPQCPLSPEADAVEGHGQAKPKLRESQALWSTHQFYSSPNIIDNVDTYYQRKFRNLTSDYTESCCWRSVNQEMWSRRCDTAEMCDIRIWRVGSARNGVFYHSFVASPARKVRS